MLGKCRRLTSRSLFAINDGQITDIDLVHGDKVNYPQGFDTQWPWCQGHERQLEFMACSWRQGPICQISISFDPTNLRRGAFTDRNRTSALRQIT